MGEIGLGTYNTIQVTDLQSVGLNHSAIPYSKRLLRSLWSGGESELLLTAVQNNRSTIKPTTSFASTYRVVAKGLEPLKFSF